MLKGEKPFTERPGALLQPADLEAERQEIEAKLERKISDQEFASYLMYPKVFTDFAGAQTLYGPTSVLPTPVYFYGLAQEQEVFVEIEREQTRMRALEVEWGQLQLEQGTWSGHARIEKLAREQLKMQPPETDQMIALDAPEAAR